MEVFTSLPVEKQARIVNAALLVFGTNGYKKASINDIAMAAGISKAMVFHYFGTKKELYIYLVSMCGHFLEDAFVQALPEIISEKHSDFFERVRLSTEIKTTLLKKHPAILSFVNTMYNETNPEVRPSINEMLANSEGLRKQVAVSGVDIHKFKDGVKPEIVMRILTWMSEGYISEFPVNPQYDIDALVQMFYECMDIMKRNFYKEEYI